MQHTAHNAYATTSRAIASPRTVEYKLFSRAQGYLSIAQSEGDTNFAAITEAVFYNNRLWTALTADLVSAHNDLPDELRAQLISLAEFQRRHGDAVLRKAAEVGPMIEVNRAVMAGLRGQVEPDAETLEKAAS